MRRWRRGGGLWYGGTAGGRGHGVAAFATFGPVHLAVIAVVVLMAVGLPLWARRSARVRLALRWVLGVLVPANEIVLWGYVLATLSPAVLLTGFLPLHVCPAAAFLIAWTLWRRTQWTYELAYYWGLTGTVQGLATPNLQGDDFASYWFVQFFISHGGTVTAVLLATVAMGLRPRRGSWWCVWLWTNVYAAGVAVLTWLLGPEANYMFLRRPPGGASPFFFLPWPWYILFLEAVALALFALAYLPPALLDRGRRRRVAAGV